MVGEPDPRLRALLHRPYVGFAEAGGTGERWLEPPGGTVTVILNLAQPFGGLPGAFVAGVANTYDYVDRGDDVCCIDLKLTPLGAYRLLGLPLHEIAGRTIGVQELLGAPAQDLMDALREEQAWERRFELVDRYLLGRAAEGPRPAPGVARVYERLAAGRGDLAIGPMADEVGWSRRHLIAMFKSQVGLPPKTMARILRFNRLLRRLPTHGRVRWAEVALEAGYYDQAHLNRDFRQFTGLPPSTFLTARLSGRPVVPDEVKSFQDTAQPAT